MNSAYQVVNITNIRGLHAEANKFSKFSTWECFSTNSFLFSRCCCFTSRSRRRRRLRRSYNWINHSRSTFLRRRWRQRQINRVNKLDFNEILLIEKNAYIWKNKLYSANDIQDVNILCLNIFSLSLDPPLERGPYRLPGPCVLLTATWSKTSTLVLQARTQKGNFIAIEAGRNLDFIATTFYTRTSVQPYIYQSNRLTVPVIHNF